MPPPVRSRPWAWRCCPTYRVSPPATDRRSCRARHRRWADLRTGSRSGRNPTEAPLRSVREDHAPQQREGMTPGRDEAGDRIVGNQPVRPGMLDLIGELVEGRTRNHADHNGAEVTHGEMDE